MARIYFVMTADGETNVGVTAANEFATREAAQRALEAYQRRTGDRRRLVVRSEQSAGALMATWKVVDQSGWEQVVTAQDENRAIWSYLRRAVKAGRVVEVRTVKARQVAGGKGESMKMREVMGKDGRMHKVPDNRGGKATGKKSAKKSAGKATGKKSAGKATSSKKSAGKATSSKKTAPKGTKYVVRVRKVGGSGAGEARSHHRKVKAAREAASRLQRMMGTGFEVYVADRAGKAAGKASGTVGKAIKPAGRAAASLDVQGLQARLTKGTTAQRVAAQGQAIVQLARNDIALGTKLREVDQRLTVVESAADKWLKGRR